MCSLYLFDGKISPALTLKSFMLEIDKVFK